MGHRSYTAEYRAGAATPAKEMGASAAAKHLKIPVDTLYTRISRAKNEDLPLSATPLILAEDEFNKNYGKRRM